MHYFLRVYYYSYIPFLLYLGINKNKNLGGRTVDFNMLMNAFKEQWDK